MASSLFPYQIAGAEALASRRKLILGDEPGLGKTRTALEAAHRVNAECVAVVCPAIVRPQWRREAAAMQVHLTFCESYNKIADPMVREIWRAASPDVLIVDEFHYLKHRYSQRSQALLASDGIAREVLANGGRVWCLSGTPMPRNPGELFAAAACLWPKTLANMGITSYMGWLARFCMWTATRHGAKVYGAQNPEELRAFLNKVMLRRLVHDVAPELPALRWGTMALDPASVADILLAEAELDEATRDALRAGQLPPMSPQIARYRHQIGDLKAPVAAALLAAELEDEPATSKKVIFAYHRSVLDVLQRCLSAFGVVRIDGSTGPEAREENKRQFITVPSRRVFLGQIEACGTGLDGLQAAAHDAVIVEPSWNSDQNVQAAHRLSRLGQSLPVLCRFLALSGSLDEAIVRQHEREAAMREQVTG